MDKVWLYGTGKGCRALFSKHRIREKFIVEGVIDSNRAKRGSFFSINDEKNDAEYCIMAPEDIAELHITKIIITVVLTSVLDVYGLLMDQGIREDVIFVYHRERNSIIKISDMKLDLVAREIQRDYFIRQVKYAMLYEYFKKKEFDACKTIAVIGDKDDCHFVKNCFKRVEPNIEVECLDTIAAGRNYDRSIFVSDNYTRLIDEYEMLYDDKNWIVLPLYDVKNGIEY